MISRRNASPRAKFREREKLRIQASDVLSTKFPGLKALKVDLQYFNPDGGKGRRIKYSVNLDHAKSAFCFDCPNVECVGGDFDLSETLRAAAAKREKVVSGELRCGGWRNKDSIRKIYCRQILRYKLSLVY